MYPHERSLVKKMEGKPFVLLGINSDQSRKALKRAIARERMTWRSWFDGGMGGPIASTYNVHLWPTTYVLDHRGVIRYSDLRGDPLDEAIARLVVEAERDGQIGLK
jgi:hypothetical protein